MLAGLLVSLLSVGCSQQGATSETTERPLMIFAAASTTDAIEEIRAEFDKLNGGQTRTNFAASATLAQQISNGAPADLFLSANEGWANQLSESGLVRERCNLLGNQLVVIVPQGSRLELRDLKDLDESTIKRLALGDPDSVPAGQYARQALVQLGLWDRLRSKVVGAADVRQALTFVESGAVDAGIVFATDLRASTGVRAALTIDPGLSDPIRYPLVLVKRPSPHPRAEALYEFLAGPTAAEIFRRHGFRSLEPAASGPK